MSHQVGLVWQGGNGWDEMVREQVNFQDALKQIFEISKNCNFSWKNQRFVSVSAVAEIQLLRFQPIPLLVHHRLMVNDIAN